MKYQLVLQFRGDALSDYDALVALEDELIAELGEAAEVDGHDTGSGETNLFLLTDDPVATFRRSRPVLERRQVLPNATAAFRLVEGEEYTVVWPAGSTGGFKVA